MATETERDTHHQAGKPARAPYTDQNVHCPGRGAPRFVEPIWWSATGRVRRVRPVHLDLAAAWTECELVANKRQVAVFEALSEIRRRLHLRYRA